MDELIARLEAATEGDTGLRIIGGLDDQIWRLVNDKQWFFKGWQYDLKEAPHYTTSLDAALTLMPDGGKRWRLFAEQSPTDDGPWWHVTLRRHAADKEFTGGFTTPALAVCLACLRALSAASGRAPTKGE